MTVHCKDKPYDTYIGRGKCPVTGQEGIWGNPFVIGQHGTREEVVSKYSVWILKQPEIIKNLYLLKGKTLGCWCNVSPCHGEILEGLLSAPKIAVIGSRSFVDYAKLEKTINGIIKGFLLKSSDDTYKYGEPIIISGCANGADQLGERYSIEKHFRFIGFPANWTDLGKRAGFVRNEHIVNNSDLVVAAWDGESKGTEHSISLARKVKKPTFIIYP